MKKLETTMGISYSLYTTIVELVNAETGTRLKTIAKYRLLNVLAELEPDVKVFEKIRQELFEEFGTLDEETQTRTVPEENQKEFFKQLDEVMVEKKSYQITKVKVSDLPEDLDIKTVIGLKPILTE